MNLRPQGYGPCELPGCSTPHMYYSTGAEAIATFSDEKTGLYRFLVSTPALNRVINQKMVIGFVISLEETLPK